MLDQYNDINIPCPNEDCCGVLKEPTHWLNSTAPGQLPSRTIIGCCSECLQQYNIEQFQDYSRWFSHRYYIIPDISAGDQPVSNWIIIQDKPQGYVMVPVEGFERTDKMRQDRKRKAIDLVSRTQKCHMDLINLLDQVKQIINLF